MLLTIMFMAYETLNTKETYGNMEKKDKNDEPLNLTNFMKKYENIFIKITIYNALMLLFGYLGEIGILNIWLSTSIGFVFLFSF